MSDRSLLHGQQDEYPRYRGGRVYRKNLIVELQNRGYQHILSYDVDTDPDLLEPWCAQAEFVFHLAGVNRPENTAEFMAGNFGFTSTLLETLKRQGNTCPVMLSSSLAPCLTS